MRSSFLKAVLAVAAMLGLSATLSAAQATPITINYTLGSIPGGSMTLVLSNTPTLTYTNLNSLISAGSKVTVGADIFNLTSINVTDLQFSNLASTYAIRDLTLGWTTSTTSAAQFSSTASPIFLSASRVQTIGSYSNGTVAPVPEPSSVALLMTALALLGGVGFLRLRKQAAIAA